MIKIIITILDNQFVELIIAPDLQKNHLNCQDKKNTRILEHSKNRKNKNIHQIKTISNLHFNTKQDFSEHTCFKKL